MTQGLGFRVSYCMYLAPKRFPYNYSRAQVYTIELQGPLWARVQGSKREGSTDPKKNELNGGV